MMIVPLNKTYHRDLPHFSGNGEICSVLPNPPTYRLVTVFRKPLLSQRTNKRTHNHHPVDRFQSLRQISMSGNPHIP